MLYLENPKDATSKWLELINVFGKVEGYKIITQKSTDFLCTNNERSEREIRESIPFYHHTNKQTNKTPQI